MFLNCFIVFIIIVFFLGIAFNAGVALIGGAVMVLRFLALSALCERSTPKGAEEYRRREQEQKEYEEEYGTIDYWENKH